MCQMSERQDRPTCNVIHTLLSNKKLDLWVSKEFEGVGNYRGQVVSHDVDMLGNTNYT